MSTTPTVVLVHGAFADASGYGGVIRRLQAEGLAVRAPMNPLRGLASTPMPSPATRRASQGPVLLVGHSYGGAVISQAAAAVKDVAGLVFLSAFALDAGESCASVQEPFPASLLASTSVPSPYEAPGAAGGPDLFIKIEEFHRTFCADLPADLAATMAVSQRPLSLAALTEKATAAGWKDLPSWYLLSVQDNAIPRRRTLHGDAGRGSRRVGGRVPRRVHRTARRRSRPHPRGRRRRLAATLRGRVRAMRGTRWRRALEQSPDTHNWRMTRADDRRLRERSDVRESSRPGQGPGGCGNAVGAGARHRPSGTPPPVHQMAPRDFNVDGESEYIRAEVLTPVGVLDQSSNSGW